MTLEEENLAEIFMPRTIEKSKLVKEKNQKFVHYTSAENGLRILDGGQIFLRNSKLMNDFSEIQHGRDCFIHAYNSDEGIRFQNLLKQIRDDLVQQFEYDFNNNLRNIIDETYIFSMSEHGNINQTPNNDPEEKFGRLSMWRAYAKNNGVAFIFNNKPFISESNAIKAYTSPVLYADKEQFSEEFKKIIDNIEANLTLIKKADIGLIYAWLIITFTLAIQATKHPSFHEEREWRIIYAPKVLKTFGDNEEEKFLRIPSENLSIDGVPQRVYKLPFRNYPEDGFEGATIPELLDKILIGPSDDYNVISQVYVEKLQSLEVGNFESKVVNTHIPLRS